MLQSNTISDQVRYAFRQIEANASNDNNAWLPAPGEVPGVKFETTSKSAPVFTPGQHATAVAKLLSANGVCTDIFNAHFSDFSGRGCLGDGRVWALATPNPYPALMPYDNDPNIRIVINASYGQNVAQNFVTGYAADFYPEQNVFNRLKTYLDTTGQVMCAALPDKGMLIVGGYLQNFPGSSNDVIAVGSLDYGHETPNGRQPDLCGYGYTSFTCPQVANAAMALIREHDLRGLAFTRQSIKRLLVDGATLMPSGLKLLNLPASLKLIGAAAVVATKLPEPDFPMATNYAKATLSTPVVIPPNAFTALPGLEYKVPETGLYDIKLRVRPDDNVPADISWGLGADTVTRDSENFGWATTNAGAYTRNGGFVEFDQQFNAGDLVKAFVYSTGTPLKIVSAAFTAKRTA